MKLLNVSAGRLHAIQIGSEVVTTGHMKAPQAEPWLIIPDGVEGDRRASHPDKIYAFTRAAYRHWGRTLGVDPARWPDGFFGENLTIEEFDEEDIRVGDVFTLGDEVRLFVAGARNPCLKLSWRLNQPPAFQRQFAKSRHAGIYFGVEAAGRVRPGDRLVRIAHDPAMPSVADVSDYLIDQEPPPLEAVLRLLDCSRLSSTNRLLLGAKLEAARRAAEQQEGRWRGWRPFHVAGTVDEAPDIRSVHLVPADGGRLPRARPGQHVQVELPGEGRPLVRSWSLSSFEYEPESYRVTVRRQGPGSDRLHRLGRGDEVRLRAPGGEFTLDMGSFRPIVLVAAGIGITPLKAMLDAHLSRQGAGPVYLIYGGRTPAALAFRAELEALAASRSDVRLMLVYSRSGTEPGRITAERVTAALSGLSIELAGHHVELPWFEAMIYICGPGSFCQELKDGLVARGGNANNILFELFGVVPQSSDLDEAQVRFAASGKTARWTADDDLSLLELAESAGIDVPSSCRSGTCLTCRSSILAGKTTADMGDGHFLPCIARPRTTEISIDL